MRFKINASDVAGLLRKKPFKGCYEEAVIKTFNNLPETAAILTRLKAKTGQKTLDEFKKTAFTPAVYEAKKVATEAIKQADRADDIRAEAAKMQVKLEQAVRENRAPEIVEEIFRQVEIKKKEVAAVAHVPSVQVALARQEAVVAKEIASQPLPQEVKERLVQEARAELVKERGTRGEEAILNTHEVERGTRIQDRNTRGLRIDYESFAIVGRIDGYDEENQLVVEVKNRESAKVWNGGTPEYDIIQLRVYMRALHCDGELVEHYKKTGETRRTMFSDNDEEWNEIEEALMYAVEELQELSNQPSRLQRILEDSTR